jgi:hypothetical protein
MQLCHLSLRRKSMSCNHKMLDYAEPLLVVVIKDSPQPHSPLELGFMNTNSDLQDKTLVHSTSKQVTNT